jgi:xylulokinase
MSLLGIDVGTTGCKAAVFSAEGALLASAYQEYDIRRPEPGWAELDTAEVWAKVRRTIQEVAAGVTSDPVQALSVSSLGEAVVPVTAECQALGPSLLNFDRRGEEYLSGLRRVLQDEHLYRLNGNTLGNHYTLTKLMWLQEHQADLCRQVRYFLPWGSFVSCMLGAEPAVDYSLANRTLLFDVDRAGWSTEILGCAGLDPAKLPPAVAAGTSIGSLAPRAAAEMGLRPGAAIVAGAHDQCANAVGCGVVQEGQAVYGMGTFLCITAVFRERREPALMIARGLNTEHHAVPGRYVTFLYNQGGSLVKWFRDTFAAAERQQAGGDLYAALLAEMPARPSGIVVLPHFATTGPPEFIADSCGVVAGLRLETPRGAVLKGILEGSTFYLRECVESLPPTGIAIAEYRAVGGGSKSDAWVQLCADIMGRPFVRPRISEAGVLGAAIIAGVGAGTFPSFEAGVAAMVGLQRTFEPDPERHEQYGGWFERYRQLWPLLRGYLRDLAAEQKGAAGSEWSGSQEVG